MTPDEDERPPEPQAETKAEAPNTESTEEKAEGAAPTAEAVAKETSSETAAKEKPEPAPETVQEAKDDAKAEATANAEPNSAPEAKTQTEAETQTKAKSETAAAADLPSEAASDDAASHDADLIDLSSRDVVAHDDVVTPGQVIAFWREAGAERWFRKNEAFDAEIRVRFGALHQKAARGELEDWADEPEGVLALLLLLDQFPRNIYRGSAHAFATDPLARQIAGRAVERGFDHHAGDDMRVFFYLPFEHSEDPRDQAMSIALVSAIGDDDLVHWAQLHADIIDRFGRFPHRNAALGRVTTDAERRFLAEGSFSG